MESRDGRLWSRASSATVPKPARVEPNRHIAGVDQSPRDIGRRNEDALSDGASDVDGGTEVGVSRNEIGNVKRIVAR